MTVRLLIQKSLPLQAVTENEGLRQWHARFTKTQRLTQNGIGMKNWLPAIMAVLLIAGGPGLSLGVA
jgi:hypothetical protein